MKSPERGIAQTYECKTQGKTVWITNGYCDESDNARCSNCPYFKSDKQKNVYLTREEEIELGKRIEAGDIDARNTLIERNMRLVQSIAAGIYRPHGMCYEDAVSIGNLGLIRAAEKYNYRKGNKFSTYAVWWIKQFIYRGIGSEANVVSFPNNKQETFSKYCKVVNRLEKELQRAPSTEECATAMKIPYTKLSDVVNNVSNTTIYLNSVDDEANDLISVPSNGHDSESRISVEQLFKKANLTKKEESIIRMKHLEEMTLQQIATVHGLTRERIRQILVKALKKMRNPKKRLRKSVAMP